MQKFTLTKDGHTVSTVSPTEAVTYRARGYSDVQPEAPKPQTPKTKAASKAEDNK